MKKKQKFLLQLSCILSISVIFTACKSEKEPYLQKYVSETAYDSLPAEENADTKGQELSDQAKMTGETEGVFSNPAETEEAAVCYVYVCGAVANPGVYALPSGSRVYEAVELAGGLLQEADAAAVNQAEQVFDGQMIRIYTYEEIQKGLLESEKGSQTVSEEDGRVNINTADRSMLMTLPGIGASKADAILAYRESKGAFADINELMNIPGIKEGIFEQLKEHIKIN